MIDSELDRANAAKHAFTGNLIALRAILERSSWTPPLQDALAALEREEPDLGNYDLVHRVLGDLDEALDRWTIAMGKALSLASNAFDVLEDYWTTDAVEE